MRGLVIIDPEAPGGSRRASYGPVVNGHEVPGDAEPRPGTRHGPHGLRRARARGSGMGGAADGYCAAAHCGSDPMLRRVKTDLTRATQKG